MSIVNSSSHEQAVQELMETFGWSQEQAEEAADLEEVGFVLDETGAILADVDPDAPVDVSRFTDPPIVKATDEEDAAQWN